MKNGFIILYVLISCLRMTAQNFSWAVSAPGEGIDEGIAVCNDNTGNVIITGQFTGSTVAFGNQTLTNNAGSSIFLTKYDCNGNVLWTRKALGSGLDYGNSVSCDPAGNIFVSGYFQSSTLVFGNFTLTNNGNYDLFLAKYDALGNVLWARAAGGASNEFGYCVKADNSGNVFVTGSYASPALVLGNYTLTNDGASDGYLAKFDASGTVLWAAKQAGTVGDENWSVTTDAAGNAYIAGDYVSPSVSFGTNTITNTGLCPVYVAKYSSSGVNQWAISGGGMNYDFANSIVCDAGGNVIVNGCFTSASMVIGSHTLINNGGEDVFVARISPAGAVLWAKAAGGPGNDKGYGMSTDASGIYCSGTFTNSIVFGTSTLTAPPGAPDPMFIVTYDYGGNVLCADFLETGGDDQTGISADQLGNAYVVADLIPNPTIIGTHTLNNYGTENIFVARYQCTEITDLKRIAAGQDVTLFPNPSGGSFTLSIANFNENAEFMLFNALGQLVHSERLRETQAKIETGLKPGLYHYLIKDENGKNISGKLVFK